MNKYCENNELSDTKCKITETNQQIPLKILQNEQIFPYRFDIDYYPVDYNRFSASYYIQFSTIIKMYNLNLNASFFSRKK